MINTCIYLSHPSGPPASIDPPNPPMNPLPSTPPLPLHPSSAHVSVCCSHLYTCGIIIHICVHKCIRIDGDLMHSCA